MRGKILILIMLIATSVSSITFLLSVAAEETTLFVDPPVLTGLEVDYTFTIRINVSDVIDLAGWEFQLYYNSAVLNGISVSQGPFLKTADPYPFFYTVTFTDDYNATHGLVHLTAAILTAGPGANGSGTLATITFRTKAMGESILDLDYTMLIDSAQPFGNLIPHTTIDGFVQIGIHDVAITNVTPSTAQAQPGQIVNITVQARNQGNFTETLNVTAYYNSNTIGTLTYYATPGTPITFNFNWNTTGATPGTNYTISAEASAVPYESDTTNNIFIDGTVYIKKRDIAIINVLPSQTEVDAGETVNINVTATNEGDTPENFNVTAYYNTTAIATQNVADLAPGTNVTLTFTWNTAGVTPDMNYTISAEASILPNEVDTENNILVDGTVYIKRTRDIAIVNTIPSTTKAHVGRTVNITVTAENRGPTPETFNVTAYYDTTPVGTQTVTDLAAGANVTLTFSWNTTNLTPYSNYTIWAEASQVPDEISIDNNKYVDGSVTLTMLGDVNGDRVVNLYDLFLVARAYGTEPGSPNWNPAADLNDNKIIDINDLNIVAHNYGTTY